MTCKWILQQENDPKHHAGSAKDSFKSKKIKVLNKNKKSKLLKYFNVPHRAQAL